MKRPGKLWLAWMALGVAALLALYVPMQQATRATRESGQRSLLVQAERQLAEHYAQRGRYPESLQEMKFEFHEGADSSTLARLQYHTDGKYYRIVTWSDYDGREISVCH